MEFNGQTIKALVGEFLVSYLFIFSAVYGGGGPVVFVAATALIFAFGGISGAHFNPAVTVGAMVGQKIDLIQGILYIVLQTVAGIAACGTVKLILPDPKTVFKANVHPLTLRIATEVIATFFLVFVIYAVALGVDTDAKSLDGDNKAADQAAAKKNFAPLAIGSALGALAWYQGPFFNPAVATGFAVAQMHFGDLWIPWACDLGAAILAAVLHTYFFAN